VAVFLTVSSGAVFFSLERSEQQHLPESCCFHPKLKLTGDPGTVPLLCHQANYSKGARRKTSRKPSEIPFHSGESAPARAY